MDLLILFLALLFLGLWILKKLIEGLSALYTRITRRVLFLGKLGL